MAKAAVIQRNLLHSQGAIVRTDVPLSRCVDTNGGGD